MSNRSRGLDFYARLLLPPVLLVFLGRWYSRLSKRVTSQKRITSFDALDQQLDLAAAAATRSDDELRAVLSSFRFELPFKLPVDPFSEAYRQAQLEIYQKISGNAAYDADTHEQSQFDLESAIKRPFPYATQSTTTVGEQLMAIGFLIRELNLAPGQHILEFGPGWGKTTLELARMGHHVTAVDISAPFLKLIEAQAGQLQLEVETVCSDMLTFESDQRFDRILFYECFHHCADHQRLLAKLERFLMPGGKIVFAGEPITDDFPSPWGVRLDGMSVYSIRRFGWLELGFRTDYFLKALEMHGYTVERYNSLDVPWQTIFIASKS